MCPTLAEIALRVSVSFQQKYPPVLSYDVLRQQKRSYDQGGCVQGGVDLRLRRIMSSPSQTLRRRLVHTATRPPCVLGTTPSVAALIFTLRYSYCLQHCIDLYAAIFVQNLVFCLPHLHSTPLLGGFPSKYRHLV